MGTREEGSGARDGDGRRGTEKEGDGRLGRAREERGGEGRNDGCGLCPLPLADNPSFLTFFCQVRELETPVDRFVPVVQVYMMVLARTLEDWAPCLLRNWEKLRSSRGTRSTRTNT